MYEPTNIQRYGFELFDFLAHERQLNEVYRVEPALLEKILSGDSELTKMIEKYTEKTVQDDKYRHDAAPAA